MVERGVVLIVREGVLAPELGILLGFPQDLLVDWDDFADACTASGRHCALFAVGRIVEVLGLTLATGKCVFRKHGVAETETSLHCEACAETILIRIVLL